MAAKICRTQMHPLLRRKLHVCLHGYCIGIHIPAKGGTIDLVHVDIDHKLPGCGAAFSDLMTEGTTHSIHRVIMVGIIRVEETLPQYYGFHTLLTHTIVRHRRVAAGAGIVEKPILHRRALQFRCDFCLPVGIPCGVGHHAAGPGGHDGEIIAVRIPNPIMANTAIA